MGRKVWINGELLPESEAKISVYDSALMFGDMVFEMTRSFGGEQFKLSAHLERLYAGLKILRIFAPLGRTELEEAVAATIQANQAAFAEDDEHRIMIDVTRGLLGIYHGVEGHRPGPCIVITDFPLRWTVAGMGRLFDTGINAVITSQRAIPSRLLDPRIKNRSRIHYLMANIEASLADGEDNWALLLDEDGFIAEGTGDNFLFVKDGVICTPEGRNVLRGVSRQYVMDELAQSLGYSVEEGNFEPYDVYTADEAFMTGTPFCMLPVTSLNGLPIGDGKVGPAFRSLLARWSESVGVDIAGQIQQWDSEGGGVADSDGAPSPYRFGTKRS